MRLARRSGSPADSDPEYLPLDPASGALLVTGAGAAASATALRIADGNGTDEADVVAGRLSVTTQHAQPLTNAELRAAAVPVAGPLTDAQLRAAALPVAGPLTDAQLAARLPLPVTGPLTSAELAARGLATDAALLPLLEAIRDQQYRRTDPLPAGSNSIGHVTLDLEAETLLLLPSVARTAGGQSAPFDTSRKSRVAIDVSLTAVAGVTPSLRLFLDRMGADGLWYPIWTGPAMTAAGTASTTVGQGMTVGQSLAASCRLRWELTGTGASATFSASVVGK